MSDVSPIFKTTKPVMLNFPALIDAKRFKGPNGKEQGEPKFSTGLVFAQGHVDLDVLKATALAVAKAKWPARDIAADFKAGNFKMPWTSGNKQIEKRNKKLADKGKEPSNSTDFLKDTIVVQASTGVEYPPRLAVYENGKISPDLEGATLAQNKGKFYSGVMAYVELNLRAYEAIKEGDKDGVTAYLNLVLSTNTGKRLGGGRSAAETFAGCVGKSTEVDATAGADELGDDESL